ncbi:MAG: MarR family transcriptional regulator [Myxococcota bacterium]
MANDTKPDVVSEAFRRELEAVKRANVPQLLFKCARLLNEHSLSRLRQETGQTGLRTVHTTLFPHIDLEGTRLTVLARRLGISKQAVGQLVDELVEMNTLERVPDPSDGRAKLIRFSEGGQSLLHGLELLKTIEMELAEAVGQDAIVSLHRILLQLHDVLEAREHRAAE